MSSKVQRSGLTQMNMLRQQDYEAKFRTERADS